MTQKRKYYDAFPEGAMTEVQKEMLREYLQNQTSINNRTFQAQDILLPLLFSIGVFMGALL